MARTRVTVTDTDHGYKRLAATLGELGTITLGVQGKEAEEAHPSPTRWGGPQLTVGQVAAIHELGLGVKRRSWLGTWLDENQARLLAETADKLAQVLRGTTTRNKALQELGYKWTAELRDRIWEGQIRPRLADTTIAIKGGEWRPLLETGTLMNAITYKVFLPNLKSIKNVAQRAAARARGR